MKRFRNLFAILLALTLMLAGCGGEGSEGGEEAEVPEGKAVSLGVITEVVYENEYLDVRFAPENWQLVGAEDLQADLEDVRAMMEDTEVGEQMEGLEQVMDMQGMAPDGMSNVNVVYTRTPTMERIANLAIDEDTAMDAILAQKDALFESYAAAGIEAETMEKCTVIYRGEERIGIKTVGSVQGIPCFILQVYERTLGDYSAAVTVSTFQEDSTEVLMEMFEKLNP